MPLQDIGPVLFNSVTELADRQRVFDRAQNRLREQQLRQADEEEKARSQFRRPAKIKRPDIGRNDPCWCGSAKKFKKCHYPNQ